MSHLPPHQQINYALDIWWLQSSTWKQEGIPALYATLPQSCAKGTKLMSQPRREIISFHEQVEKWKEFGSEANIIVILLPSLSAQGAGWTRRRERAPSGRVWWHTPHLCNATAQGKYDSEDASESQLLTDLLRTGTATFCPVSEQTRLTLRAQVCHWLREGHQSAGR